MNVQCKEKKALAIVICICFLLQIIFRSFCFDSMAMPSNTVIALIFRDANGYHIRNISSFLDSDGTLTLPTPRDLGDTNDESYSNWSPILVENSFENVKNVIRNDGNLVVEDYDVSDPPHLATSSVATPSAAAGEGDLVIRTGFLPMSDYESRNASITLYRSNVYFSIGSRVHIARAGNLNSLTDGIRQFVSKNGNRNQIFFLAVQPPADEDNRRDVPEEPDTRPNTEPSTEESRAVEPSTEESRQIEQSTEESRAVEPSTEESRQIEQSTKESRQIEQSTEESRQVSNNDNTNEALNHGGRERSDTSNSNNDRSTSNDSVRNNVSAESKEASDNIQSPAVNDHNEESTAAESQTDTSQITRTYIPTGGNSRSNGVGRSGTGPRVSISTDTSNNRSNGFINTRSTSVNVEDNNFDANNYSVLVYKNVDGKEVLSNAKYSWSSDGDSHKANILFDDDGKYRISVVKNGANSFEERVHVDSIAPTITITGVENLTANARTVTPVISYSDVNIDLSKSKITLTAVTGGKSRELLYKAKQQDGGYILNLDPIYIDDNYVLTVTIYDLAGNITEKQVNFSVNKNGATFKFKPEELVGQYTNKPFTPSIEVWNTDEISIVSATINGTDEPYEFVDGELKFLKPIEKDGKYIFNLEVIDTAGNKSSMKPVEVIYDATKPVSIISGVEEGKSYKGSVNIILSTELPGDFIESVWLDDRLLDKSEYNANGDGNVTLNVADKGSHTIKVQAKDLAGNLSDINEVSFDIQAPNAKLLSASYIPLAVITLGLALGLGLALRYKKRKDED